ncbi:MAG: protease complex subunit PrcB family protein [Firmicutes bacterium]|nr:protease complex subunit PrcB family protein [Bacillota bacterium]
MTENKVNTAESGKSGGKFSGKLRKLPWKRIVVVVLVLAILLGAAYLILGQGFLSGVTGGKHVEFTNLEEDKVPQTIVKDVIPEYRDLERALGCLVDGKVYVIVTRGEKPTAGYGVTIEKMRLEKTDQGENLVVTALFTEPEEGKAVSQVITYPYQVAETELTTLPATIELRTRFE